MGQERELLLLYLRAALGNRYSKARIGDLVEADVDWPRLVNTAEKFSVLPLLQRGLHLHDWEHVPEAFRSELAARCRKNAARALYLTNELRRLLRLFREAGIPAVPFKGPVLALSLFGDVTLRQYKDLDFLLHETDVPRAVALLEAQGFPVAKLLDFEHSVARREDGLEVDLHWTFAPGNYFAPLTLGALWQRLETAAVGGDEVPALGAEDTLLMLCVNAAKDHWLLPVAPICEIAQLVRTRDLDWAAAAGRARELGYARILAMGLLLAEALAGAELPASTVHWMNADATARGLAARVRAAYLTGTRAWDGVLGAELFRARMKERVKFKIPHYQHLARFALTPNEADRRLLPLPDRLHALYYLLRPARLLGRHSLRLMGALASRRRGAG